MSTTATKDEYLAEVIVRAIGPNDQYPNEAQLTAHRAKQALKEKQFLTIESKEVTNEYQRN